MTLSRDNLTNKQKDYAIFLPALSSFYATFIGKQRFGEYVEKSRLPADFETGIEGLNWLNADEAYFPYKWALYSAGHAELDINKDSPKEDMIRNRDRQHSFVLGDSGGFQIGKGVWEGDWKDVNCPKASLKRAQVLSWLDEYMDYGMILDIPAWVARSPAGAKATGISTYIEAVKATSINNDFFMRSRSGNCKFLNVLQGETHTDADDWYQRMKHYCDPKKHEQPFEGWAMGGQNMCDVNLILRRLVEMRHDGLLEKGLHDWMHFLGTSKLEWAVLLTDVQRIIRKYHNENFSVSFDCASPFLATANGQLYYQTDLPDDGKWVYRMSPSVDDKKYASDNRKFRDAVLQDHIFPVFEESPISERTLMQDVCIYKQGDLNKVGKEGNTSWDSFSYAIQMSHNVHRHIYAVQEANRQYDNDRRPKMMNASFFDGKHFRQYDLHYFRDIIDAIFSTGDKGKALNLIKHHEKYWDRIIGTRGNTGDSLLNPDTYHKAHFEFEGSLGVEKSVKQKKPKGIPIFTDSLFESGDEEKLLHCDDSGFNESTFIALEKDQCCEKKI